MSKNNFSAGLPKDFFISSKANFIATDGRSTIVELTITENELGFKLTKFESVDSNEPKKNTVIASIASTLLDAAKYFVRIDHVGLEITEC